MSVSLGDLRLGVAGCAAAVVFSACLVPASAPAQLESPPDRPMMLAPTPRSAAPAGEDGETSPPGESEAPLPDQIQVDALETVDVDTLGTLGTGNGGFAADMWRGSPRPLVDVLLPRLPVDTSSPAMRDLARRLLLSAAVAPEGEAPAGSFLALRARLLVSMGDLDGAKGLFEALPRRTGDSELARIEADARFLENDNARACAIATEHVAVGQDGYWQKAFIFCQILADQRERAALGVSLVRETGEDDTVFFELADALIADRSPELEGMSDPTPMQLAMARATGASLPVDVVASDRPGILRTVATSPNAPIELRLEAAERAEAAGALAPETLRQIYASIDFTDEGLAHPLSQAEAEGGAMSRALLYRSALAQTVPTAKAEAVAQAFDLARQAGRYASVVRTFLPVVKGIGPSLELLWFAPEAVKALLLAGDVESAAIWYGLLRSNARHDEAAAASLLAVTPVMALSGLDRDFSGSPRGLAGWAEEARSIEDGRELAALLFALLDGLGDRVPEDLWNPLLDGPDRTTTAVPHPAVWMRLSSAAADRRVGEAVLLSLLALGPVGPTEANPVTLRRVVSALVEIGLESDARALALEAAVAAGL